MKDKLSKTNPYIVDTHAHLDMEQFTDDLPEVISRAKKSGVDTIITIGTTKRKVVQFRKILTRLLKTVFALGSLDCPQIAWARPSLTPMTAVPVLPPELLSIRLWQL